MSANALASPGEPAIAKLRCGRTTCWSPPAVSIRRPALVWYRRSSTTASGKISSANIGNWRCQRGPCETPLTATLRAIQRYPRSHLDLRSGRAQCDCNSTFARPPCLLGYDEARRNRLSVIDRLRDKVAPVSDASPSGPAWAWARRRRCFFAREVRKGPQADIDLDPVSGPSEFIEPQGRVCEAVAGNASDTCLTGLGGRSVRRA